MRVVPNKGEGNCVFHAASQGLNKLLNKKLSHRELRATVCKYLENHSRQYQLFWDGFQPHPDENRCQSWETYLKLLRKIGAWGGHLEMHAIADAYNINICVLTAAAENFGNQQS